MRGLPLASSSKGDTGTRCSCIDGQVHRDLPFFNRNVVAVMAENPGMKMPDVQVCYNSTSIFEDKLPREMTGTDDRVCLKALTVGKVLGVLQRHTYWYRGISKVKRGQPQVAVRGLALLLSGHSGRGSNGVKVSIPSLCEERVSPAGYGRFKQLVSTVDGFMSQLGISLGHMKEFHDWKLYDRVMRVLILGLIPDYLRTDFCPGKSSFFKKIKALRKSIKREGLRQHGSSEKIDVPRELSVLRPVINQIVKGDLTLRRVFITAVMSQTRACGLPPPHMGEESFRKFREVTTSETEVTRDHKIMVARAVKSAVDSLATHHGDDILPRLRATIKEAKVSLSDSAEFDNPTRMGGKLEAGRKFLQPFTSGEKTPRYVDLDTGQDGIEIPNDRKHLGEILFHESLRLVRDSDDKTMSDILRVRYSGVHEAGKVRAITVSTLTHSMCLQPASHVALSILGLLPSSRAGTKSANHAWQFFKRLSHTNPAAGWIFDHARESGTKPWIVSTDLETATDFCSHEIVKTILATFLGRHGMGFPAFYMKVCIYLLSESREVFSRFGEPFQTKRGALMGDPLTKVVLHFCLIASSKLASNPMIWEPSSR